MDIVLERVKDYLHIYFFRDIELDEAAGSRSEPHREAPLGTPTVSLTLTNVPLAGSVNAEVTHEAVLSSWNGNDRWCVSRGSSSHCLACSNEIATVSDHAHPVRRSAAAHRQVGAAL
jgi:hypothetical protein